MDCPNGHGSQQPETIELAIMMNEGTAGRDTASHGKARLGEATQVRSGWAWPVGVRRGEVTQA